MSQSQREFRNELVIQQTPRYLEPLFILYLFFALSYFVFICYILNWRYIWTPMLLLAEGYNIFTTVLFLITNRVSAYPLWQEPLKNSTVDVLIPTLNEPEEIVAMTTIGALHIKGVHKVFVLDDGSRAHIKQLAQKLGAQYLARPTHEHAKAGNMNYGLAHSKADFVICLDADHVPQPTFILRTLGYFRDPFLAIVQTPQVFYNLHSFQHRTTQIKKLWNEQTMFYEAIQPAKNAFNAAFFCGSSAILRRKALDSVGGFATGTATEDIHTSLRIHAKKWRSLFVNEKLAYGLAPEDLHEYHRQRVRWGAGSLGLLFRSSDSPLIARGLTLMQRLGYISSTLAYTQGLLKLFYFLLPLAFIFTLTQTASTSLFAFLLVYTPFFLYSLFITSVFSRRTFHYFYTDQYNILNIFSNIESLKGVIKVQKKFGVSLKIKLKREGQGLYALIMIVVAAMLLADIYGIFYWFFLLRSTANSFWQSFLFVQIFWNTINLFFILLVVKFLALYNRRPLLKHHFQVDHMIEVSKPRQTTLHITHMSLSGAIARTNTRITTQQLTLSLPFLEKNLTGEITKLLKQRGQYEVHIEFVGISLQQKVALTLYFFHILTPQLFQENKSTERAEDNTPSPSLKLQFQELHSELLTQN